MLYPRNETPSLEDALFRDPPAEYRGAPFWAWNCRLEAGLLLEEIRAFERMGFGGFVMHPRTGLDTPYLGGEFMGMARLCADQAKRDGLRAWLYDEDRWPSGAAGGEVTKDPALRSRHLLLTQTPYGGDTRDAGVLPWSRPGNRRTENGRLLACYDITLHPDGSLARAERVGEEDPARGDKWYAYLETQEPEPWYNNQTYVDAMNRAAIEKFIACTHETYRKYLSEDFGGVIPAVFTDEPQLPRRLRLPWASSGRDVSIPWTDDLPETYRARYGGDLLEDLPQILWDLPEGAPSAARWRYHDHVTERFAAAFIDTCGAWCRENGLLLTGHLMEEPTLQSQTAATGEAMRCYRGFGLPGIDMLCGRLEYTTASQCASVKNQMGRDGMLSETYGVTGWDFDFRSHKLHGDWQAALGVTCRVLHVAWAGMAGESKRDYPASIGYQSPWYEEYGAVEDHFARVNTALTRGRPIVRAGVIHPVESFWLRYGPAAQNSLRLEQMDEDFQNLTQWLLFGGIPFDFISESLLPEWCPHAGAPLSVGEMAYDVVIVPGCETLRVTTLERLEAFRDAGGRLIFLQAPPTLADAAPDGGRGARLAARAELLPFSRAAVLEALSPVRMVELRGADGALARGLIHQLRRDGDSLWLFIAHAEEPYNPDVVSGREIRIRVRGEYAVSLYDTLTGVIAALPGSSVSGGHTEITWNAYDYDSLLVRLDPPPARARPIPAEDTAREGVELPCPARVPATLSEPNVLLLDRACYALDGEPLREAEEILRADNLLRRRLGLPLRTDSIAQPWTTPDAPLEHRVRLLFRFQSEAAVSGARLTLERPEGAAVVFNGEPVPAVADGWYVDHAIRTIPLPAIREGENVLDITLPFGERVNLEWLMLLGNFGARVEGSEAFIIPPRGTLAFGDAVPQGLAFYGGNLTYHIPVTLPRAGTLEAEIPHYRGHLLKVSAGGPAAGRIFLPPYRWRSPRLEAGPHTLDITCFGNRFNTFGPVHLSDKAYTYYGPDSWRTSASQWSGAYQLRPVGVLSPPKLTLYP